MPLFIYYLGGRGICSQNLRTFRRTLTLSESKLFPKCSKEELIQKGRVGGVGKLLTEIIIIENLSNGIFYHRYNLTTHTFIFIIYLLTIIGALFFFTSIHLN